MAQSPWHVPQYSSSVRMARCDGSAPSALVSAARAAGMCSVPTASMTSVHGFLDGAVLIEKRLE
eukprot:1096726-Prymnesium_polylepis.1